MKKSVALLVTIFLYLCFWGTCNFCSATCEKMVFGGPWVFTRLVDTPETEEPTFTVQVPNNNYFLRILNGNEDGSNRVSAEWITLNGSLIAGPSDFNQNVYILERNVSLQLNNTLKIRAASTPGSFTTIYLYGDDIIAPAITITEPEEGSLFETNAIDVTGTVLSPSNGEPATVNGQQFTAANVPLASGSNTLTATATDPCGNTGTDTVTATFIPLTIKITDPKEGDSFLGRSISVTGTVSRAGAEVSVNGIPATVSDHAFTAASVPLTTGANTITAQAAHLVETDTDTITVTGIPLGVTITSPIDGQTLDNQPITVSGTVTHSAATVTVNGVSATVNGNNFTVENVPLSPGSNTLTAEAIISNETATDTVTVNFLTVSITNPTEGQEFINQPITVEGTVSMPNAQVTVNGVPANVNGAHFTAQNVPLASGTNTLIATATHDGVAAQNSCTVIYNANRPPEAKNDEYTVFTNKTLSVAAPGILGNDSDPDGDTFTAVLVSPPAHGAISLKEDGSFSYTPETDFVGTDSFTYQTSDGVGLSGMSFVFITVSSVSGIDLTPQSLDVSAIVVEPQTLEITGSVAVEIKNQGTGNVSQNYTLTLFEDINANQVFDLTTDHVLGQKTVAGGPTRGGVQQETVSLSGFGPVCRHPDSCFC